MPPGKMPADEPTTDTALVRRLIAAQFPQWAGLPLASVDSAGTANAMYRLGEDMVVRLPLVAGAAADVEKEHHWLPLLASRLPFAIPAPLGKGMPAEGCPWHWSVYRWLAGANPVVARIAEPRLLAADLAAFVAALRRTELPGGPPSYRSEPLPARDAGTRGAIEALRGIVDGAAATAAWNAALRGAARPAPAVWIHGDLQPGNLLLAQDRLSAVIDFGCLGLGDPAVDLIPAWYVLPAEARGVFRGALDVDDDTWARGRGWALSIALDELRHYRETNPVMAGIARHVVREVLGE